MEPPFPIVGSTPEELKVEAMDSQVFQEVFLQSLFPLFRCHDRKQLLAVQGGHVVPRG